jgi:hypothetical protein
MLSLTEISDRIGHHFQQRSAAQFRVAWTVKLILVFGGAFMAGLAEAFELAATNQAISHWTIAAISGVFLSVLGGVFIALTEQDASKELESAREALALARTYYDEIDGVRRIQADSRRVAELYTAMDAMRTAISVAVPRVDQIKVIEQCLQVARRSLLIAFGFEIDAHWTIGIYIAERGSDDRDQLRLVAHERSLDCEIKDARIWPIGVGVGGIAYAKSAEVIVPDLLDPAMGSAFSLDSLKKKGDEERYRSLAAVPIRPCPTNSVPWGVAIATSDRPGHFNVDTQPGVQPAEALRALAGMVALIVRLGTHLPGRVAVPGEAAGAATENRATLPIEPR